AVEYCAVAEADLPNAVEPSPPAEAPYPSDKAECPDATAVFPKAIDRWFVTDELGPIAMDKLLVVVDASVPIAIEFEVPDIEFFPIAIPLSLLALAFRPIDIPPWGWNWPKYLLSTLNFNGL